MAFRIDEFSDFPSGAGLIAEERTRFNTVGFGFVGDDVQGEVTVPAQPDSQDAIRQILLSLVELVTVPLGEPDSGFWTLAEIVDYLNERQSRFIKDTGIRLKRLTPLVVSSAPREWDLPADWLDTYRINWANVTGGSARRELPRGDSWELDHADRDWQTASQTFPTLYLEVEKPARILEVAPAPIDAAGFPEILYAAAGAALSSSSAVNFAVPDEFVPAIKWGVVSDMLSKPGRGFDPERSDYAERRYQEGVVGARLLVRGWA